MEQMKVRLQASTQTIKYYLVILGNLVVKTLLIRCVYLPIGVGMFIYDLGKAIIKGVSQKPVYLTCRDSLNLAIAEAKDVLTLADAKTASV